VIQQLRITAGQHKTHTGQVSRCRTKTSWRRAVLCTGRWTELVHLMHQQHKFTTLA